jgi:hypothetical protein
MRKRLALVLAAGLLLLGATAPVRAGSAQPLTIDAHSSFEGGATFSATGLGTCTTGILESDARVVGHGAALVFHVRQLFTCDDGSGTFSLLTEASVHPCDATDRGAWSIAGGTGAYAGLHGAGTVVGTYVPDDSCDADGIDDHFTGTVVNP